MKISSLMVVSVFATGVLAGCESSSNSSASHSHAGPSQVAIGYPEIHHTLEPHECTNGIADEYACEGVDLVGGQHFFADGSDIWGWEDPETGEEYALMGLSTGTAFLRLHEDSPPAMIGYLATATSQSSWRDLKVYQNHVFIVSEARGHGLQVFDLTRLRGLDEGTEFTADAQYSGFGYAHNIAINEETGFAYVLGSNQCSGGLYMLDISEPTAPEFAGCYSGAGYTHDAQCVIYQGSDVSYLGHEICFAANEDTLAIVDVSDKLNPILLSNRTYIGVRYAHQGWLSEDHRYFLLGDEFDELENRLSQQARTYIWDLSSLEQPLQTFEYDSPVEAVDHNLYIKGDIMYQANYQSGLRLVDISGIAQGELTELAWFDTLPEESFLDTDGAWSVYPFFRSGLIIVSNINGKVFVLKQQGE